MDPVPINPPVFCTGISVFVSSELFRTETDFLSSVFDESRTGFEVYLRKRLIGLWTGRLSYRLEVVDIFDVDEEEAAPVIIDQEGETTVSKVGFSMTRDTRDSAVRPTQGERTSPTAQT